jgi:hypothetical protein
MPHEPGSQSLCLMDYAASTATSAKVPCFRGVDLATVRPNGNLVFVEEPPGGLSWRLRMLWNAGP